MEQKREQPQGAALMMSALTLLIGAFHLVTGVVGVIAEVENLGTAAGNAGMVALFVVLFLIGAVEIVAGVIGIMSTKRAALRKKCKTIGLGMLVMTAAYVVTNVMLRGFAWSSTLGLFVSIAYLTVLKER